MRLRCHNRYLVEIDQQISLVRYFMEDIFVGLLAITVELVCYKCCLVKNLWYAVNSCVHAALLSHSVHLVQMMHYKSYAKCYTRN